jgi:tRNA pseudouridine55 synthase
MRERTGILLLDKPLGPTSRQLLDDLEPRLGIGPLGQAGTLDPLATGLLAALAGRARRLQEFFIQRDKTYVARIRFGEVSATLDAEGPVEPSGTPPTPLAADEVRALLARFEGEILQVPPAFSALRVEGRRAHRIARRGTAVELAPRKVVVRRIALVEVHEPEWVLEVTCGPGVYVRSLARDLGEARGCGAHLSALRRTRSGSFRVEDAVAPDQATVEHLKPLSQALADEPRIVVTREEAKKLLHGNVIARTQEAEAPRFAWFRDRPCFKLLSPAPGLLRSEALLDEI